MSQHSQISAVAATEFGYHGCNEHSSTDFACSGTSRANSIVIEPGVAGEEVEQGTEENGLYQHRDKKHRMISFKIPPVQTHSHDFSMDDYEEDGTESDHEEGHTGAKDEGKEAIRCAQCSRMFCSKRNLKRHVRTMQRKYNGVCRSGRGRVTAEEELELIAVRVLQDLSRIGK